jgi:hypothetical protein
VPLCGIAGAAGGLFLARVGLEAARRPWPAGLVLAVGLAAALGGLFLGRLSTRRTFRLWPACLLFVYLLWPRRDPAVACRVAVLAILTWLLGSERDSLPRWVEPLADGAVFTISLAVYAATAAPDVLPADAGEFQLVAALLGVAHPPGFPLYTMMGYLFTRLLPWGTPAYRLNLMSGVLAAGALVLVARATRLWARRVDASPLVATTGGLAAALALGSSTTFWAQATIASKRPLTAFLAAFSFYLLSRFASVAEPRSSDDGGSRSADRTLVLLGLVLGLGLGHHPGLAFIWLFFAIYVLLIDPHLAVQPRRWWRPALAGLAGLLPLAYLPIRGAMGAILAPEGLNTLPGFLHHVTAKGFAGDMFAFANLTDLPHRLALVPTLFPLQFNCALLALALLGTLGLLGRNWRLFVLLAGSLALHTFVSITYRAPQTVEYLMPAYLPIAIGVGLAPAVVSLSLSSRLSSATSWGWLPAVASPVVCALAIWAGALNGWSHGPSFVELAGDHTARQAVEPLLEASPAGALILADWRWAMPLRYLQEVEGRRADDVEVRYVYPVSGEEYRQVWLQRVQDAGPERPVLLTHFYQFDGFTTEPWETGFTIRPRPVTSPTAPFTPVGSTLGDQVRLVGYGLRQGQLYPGQVAEVVLAWQPVGTLDSRPSFTLRLVDEQEGHLAQVDQALAVDVIPGEVRFERLSLPLHPTLSPGRYRVTLGAYTVTGAGFETLASDDGEVAVTLTDLELGPPPRPPFTLHPLVAPFEDGPTLIGVDYDRSVPGVLRVYLHWRGPGGTWRTRVRAADGPESGTSLSPVAAGVYQTTMVDLQGSTNGPLWLTLVGVQGEQGVAPGAWGRAVREVRLPVPAADARFVPLGDEMAVVGAELHPIGSGEAVAVDVALVATRPLTSDDATSVRLMDGKGRWLDTHDCQPGLGAVPTLKWIRGSRVTDRHLLSIPDGFAGGDVRATLVAYERFRMTPLPSMDGRFGEVPLGTWTLP